MKQKIYEHLKTRKKYNTLQLKYDVKCEELERKIVELNTEKRLRQKEKEIFEKTLNEYLEEIVKLKAKKKGGKKNV